MSARILVVCTANVCRSPVAERLLARHLAAVGIDATVRSAGTAAGSLGVHRHTARAAEEIGLDLSDHAPRALTRTLIDDDGADLVLVMTREHLRQVVGMLPAAWPRTFTLKELVRRAVEAPPAANDIGEMLAALGATRSAGDLIRPSPDDDVEDPYGDPFRAHQQMVADMDRLVARLARQIAPTERHRTHVRRRGDAPVGGEGARPDDRSPTRAVRIDEVGPA